MWLKPIKKISHPSRHSRSSGGTSCRCGVRRVTAAGSQWIALSCIQSIKERLRDTRRPTHYPSSSPLSTLKWAKWIEGWAYSILKVAASTSQKISRFFFPERRSTQLRQCLVIGQSVKSPRSKVNNGALSMALLGPEEYGRIYDTHYTCGSGELVLTLLISFNVQD